jgi:hypothetical protein
VKDSSFTRLAHLATLRHQSSKSPFCYLMPPYLHLMLRTTCPYHGQVNTPFKAKNHLLSMSHRTDRAKHSLPGCTYSAAPPFRFFLNHVAQSDLVAEDHSFRANQAVIKHHKFTAKPSPV